MESVEAIEQQKNIFYPDNFRIHQVKQEEWNETQGISAGGLQDIN